MLYMRSLILIAQFLGNVHTASISERITMGVNPIRRVVNLLNKMKEQVELEGKKDKVLHEKYMCYCKSGIEQLEASVEEATNKVPQLEASVKEAVAQKAQLDEDIKTHKQDRADAREAIAKGKSLREKEEAAYAKESSETKTNIKALGKALSALEAGSSSFLQTTAAAAIRKLAVDVDMSSTERDILSRFLAQDNDGYTPQNGEIVGILKEMKDTMERSLEEMDKEEVSSKRSYESMLDSKKKEAAGSSRAIEDKLARTGDTSVLIQSLQKDLDDTSGSLSDNQLFLAELQKGCDKKDKEWQVIQSTRTMELQAIAETVKILNDDGALDLFKKTLPNPSLIQMKVTVSQMRQQALKALHGHKRNSHRRTADPRMDFLALMLRGKKVSFDKVIGMIDNMVKILKQEQKDDDKKKHFCEEKLDTAEDESKVLGKTVSDIEKARDDAKGSLQTLSEEILALEKGIKDLDDQVMEATENRKSEHEEYQENLSSSKSAKDLLLQAKNRLNKFYNPKLYRPSEAEFLEVGTRGATEMSEEEVMEGAPSLAQVTLRIRREVPPPPPEAVGAYMKKSDETTGVMEMIGVLITDLDKEMTQMDVEEKDSQAEYERFVKASATKRTEDLKSVADKGGAKADVEAKVEKLRKDRKYTIAKNMAVDKYLQDLHKECDWLLSNIDVRSEAREGEIASLLQAKNVLSGADFSLVQLHRGYLLARSG